MSRTTHHDLIALALGRLDPPARERVERALALDAALRREHAAIVTHLACYEDLPATATPPPFASVRSRLERAPARPRPSWRPAWGVAAVAAAVMLALVVGRLRDGDDAMVPLAGSSVGPGARVERAGRPVDTSTLWAGDRVRAERVAAVRLSPRTDCVLDAGTALDVVGAERVAMTAGRAFFTVEPADASAPVALVVRTPHGDVVVRGTAFEVSVHGGLDVVVERGRVEVVGVPVEAGARWRDGLVAPHDGAVGDWYRRPTLAVGVEGQVGGALALVVTLTNPTAVPLTVPDGDGVRSTLWLRVEGPDGEVVEVPVAPGDWSGAQAVPDGWRLGSDGTGRRRIVLAEPFRPAGVYRLRAMYRPLTGGPVVSPAVEVEVR
jgi:hypothetical protein